MQDSVESGSLELWRMSLGPEAGECTYTCIHIHVCVCYIHVCLCTCILYVCMYMYIVCVYVHVYCMCVCTCIYVHVSVHRIIPISYAHNIIHVYMATQLSSWSFFPCLCFGSSLQPYHASMHVHAQAPATSIDIIGYNIYATSYSQLKH